MFVLNKQPYLSSEPVLLKILLSVITHANTGKLMEERVVLSICFEEGLTFLGLFDLSSSALWSP